VLVSTAGAEPLANHDSVFCSAYLPGNQAAARADLVVCNGGSPTTFQALSEGVPVLGIPGNLDQFLNMHYLERWRCKNVKLTSYPGTRFRHDWRHMLAGDPGAKPQNACAKSLRLTTRQSARPPGSPAF
jgi:hypothetical protein